MKKNYFLLLGILIGYLGLGQCTINTALTQPGIYSPGSTTPDSVVVMPDGAAASYYDESAQLVVPADTMIDTMGFTIPATIDSMKITGFSGLPASLSYACDNSECLWIGGDNGCVNFTGTPTTGEMGTHNVTVQATGYATVPGFGQMSGVFNFYMKISINGPVSVNENDIIDNSFSIHPNPMTDKTSITYRASENSKYTLKILDITGRQAKIYQGVSVGGENEIFIQRENMAPGLYLYSLTIGEYTRSGRLMVK